MWSQNRSLRDPRNDWIVVGGFTVDMSSLDAVLKITLDQFGEGVRKIVAVSEDLDEFVVGDRVEGLFPTPIR